MAGTEGTTVADWHDPNGEPTAYDPNPDPTAEDARYTYPSTNPSGPGPGEPTGYYGPPSYQPAPYRPAAPYPPTSPYRPPAAYPSAVSGPPTMPSAAPSTYRGYSDFQVGPGYPGYLPPPPPRRHRRRWILGGLAALVAVIVVVAVALPSSSSPRPSITAPTAAGGYNQIRTLSSSELQTLISGAGQGGGAGAQLLESSQVAVYGQDNSGIPNLVFVGVSANSSAGLRSELASGYAAVADEVLTGMGAQNPTDEAPGATGYALHCGQVDELITQVIACAWADRAGVGAVLLLSDQSAASAAATTTAFRTAAEH
jgi:hypothetical protein